MSDPYVERNKKIVERLWLGMFVKRDMSVVKEILGPNYVFNGSPATAAGTVEWAEKLFLVLPDLEFNIEIILGEGDQVAHRWKGEGTVHMPGNPFNGKKIKVNGTNVSAIDADGWMVSNWQSGGTPADFQLVTGHS